MTLKASIVTAIVGATLVLGVPTAWGKAQPVQGVSSDAVERAVLAQELSQRQDAVVLQDAFERAVSGRQHESTIAPVPSDAFERAIGGQQSRSDFWNYDPRTGEQVANASPGMDAGNLGSLYSTGLERPSDTSIGMNRQYGLGTFAGLPGGAFERAVVASERGSVADRSIGLNRVYGLGEFTSVPSGDAHGRVAPLDPISTPTVSTGRDVDWPQVGIGFAIGLLLALGLALAARMARIRPLAH